MEAKLRTESGKWLIELEVAEAEVAGMLDHDGRVRIRLTVGPGPRVTGHRLWHQRSSEDLNQYAGANAPIDEAFDSGPVEGELI